MPKGTNYAITAKNPPIEVGFSDGGSKPPPYGVRIHLFDKLKFVLLTKMGKLGYNVAYNGKSCEEKSTRQASFRESPFW